MALGAFACRRDPVRHRGTFAAPTLTVRTPTPSSGGSTAGSAAASPQTDRPMPASCAARHAGDGGQHRFRAADGRSATRSRPRTSAVRSFVPMEKKSTCAAKAAAARRWRPAPPSCRAAAGPSRPPWPPWPARPDVTHLVERADHGDHDRGRCPRPPSRIAASWAASAPGAARNAGSPSAPGNGGILSPAKSSSRTTARLPASRPRMGKSRQVLVARRPAARA